MLGRHKVRGRVRDRDRDAHAHHLQQYNHLHTPLYIVPLSKLFGAANKKQRSKTHHQSYHASHITHHCLGTADDGFPLTRARN